MSIIPAQATMRSDFLAPAVGAFAVLAILGIWHGAYYSI